MRISTKLNDPFHALLLYIVAQKGAMGSYGPSMAQMAQSVSLGGWLVFFPQTSYEDP